MVIALYWKIGDNMKKYEVITTNPIKVRKFIKTRAKNIRVLTNLKDKKVKDFLKKYESRRS